MDGTIRILYIEDSEEDSFLTIHHIEQAGHKVEWRRIETASELENSLKGNWDTILCDYMMPKFSGLEAIKIWKDSGIDIPLIVISGRIGEETAVEAMKAGADDYMMKDNLRKLVPSIQREINAARTRQDARKTRLALYEAEQKYRLFVDEASDAIFIVQEERIEFANARTEEFSGYSLSELSQKKMSELIHADDRAAFGERIERLFTGRVPLDELFVARILLKDGKICWTSYNGMATIWRDKPAILLYMRHATARGMNEYCRRLCRDYFIHFMHRMPGPVSIKDPDGHFIFINEQGARLIGRPSEEIINKKMSEINPSTSISSEVIEEIEQRVLKMGQPFEGIQDYYIGSEKKSYFVIKFPLPEDDGSISVGTILLDVTERIKAERALRDSELRLREAQDIARMIDWEFDPSTGQFSWPSHPYSMGDTESPGLSGRKGGPDWFDSEDQARIRNSIDAQLAPGERFEFDKKIELPNGRFAYHHVVYLPVKDEYGMITKIRGISVDSTQLKQKEVDLEFAMELIEQDKQALEEKNIALREILSKIEEEKKILKNQFATNIDHAIMPTLLRLEESSHPAARKIVQTLRRDLEEVASPFIGRIKNQFASLSPRELEICHLIKRGMTTKEIAEMLRLSPATVQKFRELIRRKLNLTNSEINLNTFMQSLE